MSRVALLSTARALLGRLDRLGLLRELGQWQPVFRDGRLGGRHRDLGSAPGDERWQGDADRGSVTIEGSTREQPPGKVSGALRSGSDPGPSKWTRCRFAAVGVAGLSAGPRPAAYRFATSGRLTAGYGRGGWNLWRPVARSGMPSRRRHQRPRRSRDGRVRLPRSPL